MCTAWWWNRMAESFFPPTRRGESIGLNPDRKASLLVETSEGEATRLLQDQGGLLAATGDMGKLFRFGFGGGRKWQLRIAGA